MPDEVHHFRAIPSQIEADTRTAKNGERRLTLTGRLVPYGVVADVLDMGPDGKPDIYREGFRRGAFEAQTHDKGTANKISLIHKHEGGLGYLGPFTSLREEDDGLYGEVSILRTKVSDVEDLIDSGVHELSIEFRSPGKVHTEIDGSGVRWRVKAHLDQVALEPRGAYRKAEVLSLRAEVEAAKVREQEEKASAARERRERDEAEAQERIEEARREREREEIELTRQRAKAQEDEQRAKVAEEQRRAAEADETVKRKRAEEKKLAEEKAEAERLQRKAQEAADALEEAERERAEAERRAEESRQRVEEFQTLISRLDERETRKLHADEDEKAALRSLAERQVDEKTDRKKRFEELIARDTEREELTRELHAEFLPGPRPGREPGR